MSRVRRRRRACWRYVAAAGRDLSEARTAAAGRLAARRRSGPGRPRVPPDHFQVAVARGRRGRPSRPWKLDGERVAFDASGLDSVAFLIAPNPGEPARPLARIASGGELSRVALAIKQILAEADRTPTLVFDEIDSGIGGRSAEPVGRSLWELARTHQVLCVTHLGQIAAYADAQFRIEKQPARRPDRDGSPPRRRLRTSRRAGPDAGRLRRRSRREGERRGAARASRSLAPGDRGQMRWPARRLAPRTV